MKLQAAVPVWPRSSDSAAASLRDKLVGVADGNLRILLGGPRLALLLGFAGTNLEPHDLLDLAPDESSRTLLLLALRGVAPEVQLPSSAADSVLVARGTVTGADRSLLLYERSAADASLSRSSHVRSRHFVGREAELAAFDSFLVSDEPSIIYVHGPYGIGKTALLGAFAARCVELDCAHVRVDARSSPVCEQAIVDALSTSAGSNQTDLGRLIASSRICAGKWVLFIDNFDAWFHKASTAYREIFEILPPDTRIVLAGRRQPERRWWSGCSRDTMPIPLDVLDRDSSAALLRLHASRLEARDEALSHANGHPLCLVTLANASRMRGEASAATSDLVDTAVDSKLPPAILEAAALPSRVTEDVLAELLVGEGATAQDAYDVLATICLRDPSGVGVRMPWCLRTTVERKLQERSPERFANLRARLAAFYARRLDQCTHEQLPRLLDDALESFSDVPALKRLMGGGSPPDVRRAGAGDLAAVTAAARRAGGELAAALVERRMMSGFGATYVAVRGEAIEGILQLSLTSIDEASRAGRGSGADAPLASAVAALRALGGLDVRAPVAICTAWLTPDLAGDDFWGNSSALALLLLRKVLTATPRVVATALVMPPGDSRRPFGLIPGAHTVHEGEHTVLCTLVNRSPGSTLLALLEMTEPLAAQDTGLVPEQTLITTETVRSALMQLASPKRLAASPLMSSRLVAAATGPGAPVAARPETLARLLRGAIHSIVGTPRDERARDVLIAVFLGEGGKHEQIAREMGLPYGTFRRHLALGIEHVTETLQARDHASFHESPRIVAARREASFAGEQEPSSDEQRSDSEAP